MRLTQPGGFLSFSHITFNHIWLHLRFLSLSCLRMQQQQALMKPAGILIELQVYLVFNIVGKACGHLRDISTEYLTKCLSCFETFYCRNVMYSCSSLWPSFDIRINLKWRQSHHSSLIIILHGKNTFKLICKYFVELKISNQCLKSCQTRWLSKGGLLWLPTRVSGLFSWPQLNHGNCLFSASHTDPDTSMMENVLIWKRNSSPSRKVRGQVSDRLVPCRFHGVLCLKDDRCFLAN